MLCTNVHCYLQRIYLHLRNQVLLRFSRKRKTLYMVYGILQLSLVYNTRVAVGEQVTAYRQKIKGILRHKHLKDFTDIYNWKCG